MNTYSMERMAETGRPLLSLRRINIGDSFFCVRTKDGTHTSPRRDVTVSASKEKTQTPGTDE